MSRFTHGFLIVFAIALASAMASATLSAQEPNQQVEKYPGGQVKATYTVDADGVREGVFKEFYEDGALKVQGTYKANKLEGLYKELYPSGKIKLKRTYKKGVISGKYTEYDEKGAPSLTATYRNDQLHGTRKRLAGRKSLSEEVWLDGQLILPKSPAFLKKQLKAIQKAQVETVGEIPSTTEAVAARVDEEVRQALRVSAVRRLMMYRCVSNLPYEGIVLDRTMIAHAEAGSMVLAKLKGIDHQPPNPGLPEEEYQFALVGTMNSNLQHAPRDQPMAESVRVFMWDTDPVNVQRLGHRRWCLNPEMLKTGFGKTIVDKHSSIITMWSFDNSRKQIPDYDFFAFPVRGLQPTSLMKKEPYAWSVSFNPGRYRMPDDNSLRVKVVPARFDAKRLRMVRGKEEVALEHVHVSIEQWSYPPAVIFQPKNLDHGAGKSYWVEVSGVKAADGSDVAIGYLVSFVKL